MPKTTATPEPIPTEAPPLKRDLMIESGKDAMDFAFLLVNSDWVLTEAADSYVLSDPGGQERMMLFSMDVGRQRRMRPPASKPPWSVNAPTPVW